MYRGILSAGSVPLCHGRAPPASPPRGGGKGVFPVGVPLFVLYFPHVGDFDLRPGAEGFFQPLNPEPQVLGCAVIGPDEGELPAPLSSDPMLPTFQRGMRALPHSRGLLPG